MFIFYLILDKEYLALNKYKRIVELTDNDINIKIMLIREFDQYGYFDMAVKLLDEIIEENDYKFIALINKAKILIDNEKSSDASEIINYILDESDDNYIISDAYGLKGEISDSYEESLINFNKSLEFNPKNVSTLFNIAELYLKEGQFDDIEGIFEEILEFDPNNHDALMMLYLLSEIDF